jgi:hypothetical protein
MMLPSPKKELMLRKLAILLVVLSAAGFTAAPALADGGWGADPPMPLRP